MHRAHPIALLLVFLSIALIASQALAADFTGRVVGVSDGDTITVTHHGQTVVLAQDQQIQDIPSQPFTVTVPTPFASFDIKKATVKRDQRRTDKDRFEVRGSFVVGSDGIDVLNEEVIVRFDGFTATVPAGSFSLGYDEDFEFKGAAGGIKMKIRDDGRFKVKGRGLDLRSLDLGIPVPFVIQIGNDRGETAIPFDEKGKFKAKKKDEDDDKDKDDD